VPTLLIRGALSNVVTQEEVDDFLKTISHSEFVEIDEAAHMIAGDRNDVFANAAINFLQQTVNSK
jgi:pimeloyl-ACP methyl ester carboxylesterase